MKPLFLTFALLVSGLAYCNYEAITDETTNEMDLSLSSGSIQVALLLDTSNSMDGLINQAKSRLWNIVNTMTTLKYNGETPEIQISLYEYGNSGLSEHSNFIRQVVGLTNDLDLISEHLFALRTNGGQEYCGAVINDAVKKLDWDAGKNSMKLIYIAGNEPFDQGGVSYKEAISEAVSKDIFINTIFCGNRDEGVRTHWKDGADKGKGKYFHIDSNAKIRYIVTPYDDQITICNQQLNATYIGYGSMGQARLKSQAAQDANAEELSGANYAERVVSKSKAVYSNESWDLVDRYEKDEEVIENLKKEELPKELQGKTQAQIKAYVEAKTNERDAIQKEIAELAKKRQAYIEKEQKKEGTQDDLGKAIASTIYEIAKVKGYTIQ
tara:strand:- start:87983 stop:89128 length:1146 start_codon:yes stop_codon:yes gene_type:complete